MQPVPSTSKPGKGHARNPSAPGPAGGDGPRLPPLNNKTAKVHRLVRLLEGEGEGMSIRQMASSLAVDERTVKRYLSDLRRLKFDLELDRPSGARQARYRILSPKQEPPGHFLPALKRIRAELHAGGNPKYSSLISQLIRFLEAKEAAEDRSGESEPAPAAGIYHLDHGPFAEAEPHPGMLKILEGAIAARRCVRVNYSGLARETEEFPFYPYVLCLRVGTLYLIGRQGGNRGAFKSLSVRRIKRCIATRESFVPDPFDVTEYYKFCFGQWPRQLNEIPETVLLAVRSAWVEKYLSESRFNPAGRFLRKGQENCYELKVVIKPDFVNWVLSLVPDVIPLRPPGLRAAVRDRMQQGLKLLDAAAPGGAGLSP